MIIIGCNYIPVDKSSQLQFSLTEMLFSGDKVVLMIYNRPFHSRHFDMMAAKHRCH